MRNIPQKFMFKYSTQLVTLFGDIIESLRGRNFLRDIGHIIGLEGLYSILPVCFLCIEKILSLCFLFLLTSLLYHYGHHPSGTVSPNKPVVFGHSILSWQQNSTTLLRQIKNIKELMSQKFIFPMCI